jgi:hypothetical protein
MLKPLRSNASRRQVSNVASLPAPVWGWDDANSVAEMDEDHALVLDNWFPATGDVRVRRGHALWASGMGSAPVETLMVHNSATAASAKMFAVTDGDIYDVTSGGAATITTITSLSNSRLQWVNFTTSGGHFLWACNGQDNPVMYDGSTWSSPTLTGVTDNDIVHVNAHKNRLWFCFISSTKVGYLATGSIQGAVTEFELGGLINKGGYIVAMATWTLDGGSGQDDMAVFISSKGQVIVYQGTDPASATTWSLVGVFDLGSPLGRRCFTKAGGDVILINIDGVLPLSKALKQDRSAAENISLSGRIQNSIAGSARNHFDHFGWELCVYPKGTMAILNVPVTEDVLQEQYVMNTLTGAWCKFKGQNANCWVVFDEDLYFGGNTGLVLHADTGAQDLTEEIDAVGQTSYQYFGNQAGLKQFTMMQPLLTVSDPTVSPTVGVSTDFKDNASVSAPSAAGATSDPPAAWDASQWDVDVFGAGDDEEGVPLNNWTTVAGIGYCGSVHFNARTGAEDLSVWGEALWGSGTWATADSDDVIMRVNGFNLLFQRGAVF